MLFFCLWLLLLGEFWFSLGLLLMTLLTPDARQSTSLEGAAASGQRCCHQILFIKYQVLNVGRVPLLTATQRRGLLEFDASHPVLLLLDAPHYH